jgi:phenylpyruvate tautomerase PptA (4-oxalocrotonate tautomerase family)
MLRASFSCVLVNTAEGCASVLKRAAGSLIKPVKDKGTPTIQEGRQAFEGDLRSTSGLGVADGITDHTQKWLQVSNYTTVVSIERLERENFQIGQVCCSLLIMRF